MNRLALACVMSIEEDVLERLAVEVGEFLVEITQSEGTIGRINRGATVQFIGKSISGTHLRYRREGDSLLIEDADSTFGSFQNGQRISGTVTLNVGDHIRLAGEEDVGALLQLVRLI